MLMRPIKPTLNKAWLSVFLLVLGIARRFKKLVPGSTEDFGSRRKFVLFFSFLFIVFEGQIIEASTGSFARRAGFTVAGLVTMAVFILAPHRTAPLIYPFVLLGCFILFWIASVFVLEPRTACIFGIGFAVIEVIITMAFVWRSATRNFMAMPELHPTDAPSCNASVSEILFAHITDLHITVGPNRYQGGPGGQVRFRNLLLALEKSPPRLLLVSGDIADTGNPIEWSIFYDIVDKELHFPARVIIAPGNHDFSHHYGSDENFKPRLFFETAGKLMPDAITALGSSIETVLAEAISETQLNIETREAEISTALRHFPNAVLTLWGAEDRMYRTLLHSARQFSSLREAAAETLRDDWFEDRWYDLFPLHFEAVEDNAFVVVLNSVIPHARTIGDSAIGALGPEQFSRLGNLLATVPPHTRFLIILTHHALFRRSGEWRPPFPRPLISGTGWLKAVGDIIDFACLAHEVNEAREFLDLISSTANRLSGTHVFILCGHRHTRAIGSAGRAIVLEGGSLSEATGGALLISRSPEGVVLINELLPE